MKTIDLFCGCGGMSLGFKNAGFDIKLSADNWDKAISVYRDNFCHNIEKMDLTDEKSACDIFSEINPEIIIGGPPCQDFSSAGKRDETLGRADLTYHYANIVCQVKPNFFVMENVERIKKSKILSDIISQFKDNGYGLTPVILDASYCNVPQARTRFFLIGHKGGKDNALLPFLAKGFSEHKMTIREYLGDSLGVDYYYRHPRNYSRRGVFSIDEPSPTVRGVNRPVPPSYALHDGDPKNTDLDILRPLTTIERSYLQTFPKEFVFNGTKTNLEQMIGNAVPVNLANYVAKAIKEYVASDFISEYQVPDFKIPNTNLKRMLLIKEFELIKIEESI
ncbi:DNA cytosine methyltransferase [Photobacterium iliopiscarium]|uniref:DNA cytosine methyltransferase n=1 Tax=Photobacterium iliopiscarium TaxID=56192 RepID=UPI001E3B4436|nr:DNA cytosine methyltransferase [Photobacterium iliopiscarium]MCD9468837.1 DNA (cytosine-5-)-methyltransferase [Photobacterium iliopiscarium]MCD9488954.1 DNA (cytosine-5-)-methyltransferase [Photobacterium iliopiscarium]MCF2245649.1 DNA (cytosine-5-)-methyltransferase [Photobacterium iliopiscarium]